MYKIDFCEDLNHSQMWNTTISSSIFEKKAFLQANIISNKDIKYIFAEIQKNHKLIGKILIQIVPFEGKELKNYLSEDFSCLVKATVESILEKINWNLAVVGNLFVSGNNGQFWSHEIHQNERSTILKELCKKLKDTQKVQSVLISELDYSESKNCKDLIENGFQLFEIEPEIYMDIPANWKQFEDYLSELKSKYRVRTKKVLQDSKALETKILSAEQIKQEYLIIHKLHKNVTNKIGFKLAEVSKDYFYNLKLFLKDDFTFTAYYLEGKMIGFINTIKNLNTLEVHLIGMDYDSNKKRSLYQRILYDCVKEAIDQKMSQLNFGKTATTIKTTVGGKTKATFALIKHSNSVSNLGIKPLFKYLKPDPAESRNPFKKAI